MLASVDVLGKLRQKPGVLAKGPERLFGLLDYSLASRRDTSTP